MRKVIRRYIIIVICAVTLIKIANHVTFRLKRRPIAPQDPSASGKRMLLSVVHVRNGVITVQNATLEMAAQSVVRVTGPLVDIALSNYSEEVELK